MNIITLNKKNNLSRIKSQEINKCNNLNLKIIRIKDIEINFNKMSSKLKINTQIKFKVYKDQKISENYEILRKKQNDNNLFILIIITISLIYLYYVIPFENVCF